MRGELGAGATSTSGEIPWGTHFCQLYRTKQDFIEVVAPYFAAGLAKNERCLWVTADAFPAAEARAALASLLPRFVMAEKTGQIEIIEADQTPRFGDPGDEAGTLKSWLEREERALAEGHSGLRVVGATLGLTSSEQWSLAEHESNVNRAFRDRRIIGLCSYSLDQCGPSQVIDVVRHHEYALVKGESDWQILEHATLKDARDDPPTMNDLEARVAERTAELEAALSARDEFLSIASHELKTPITALQLYLDGLLRTLRKRTLPPADVEGRLGKVREQCVRLDRLVSNLLDISRASATTLAIYPEPVDLTELALSVMERFREDFQRSGSDLDFRTGGPVFGSWDRARLDQVLASLLSNALRYAPGGPVRVSVMQDGAFAKMSVTDRGPGIDPADQARIFERFTRLAPARYHGGFGLGLWIAKKIIQAHEGAISVSSEPGAGAVFTVVLPRSTTGVPPGSGARQGGGD